MERLRFKFPVKNIQLWSPKTPRLYEVYISLGGEKIKDKIGFRTVKAEGKKILLNGKPVFLRGICIHEEIAPEVRRANSAADAAQLLGWAKDLNCNMVRLAHYPHNENMTRMADHWGCWYGRNTGVLDDTVHKDEVLAKAKRNWQK